MIKLQVNTGDDYNQNQVDVGSDDFLVFSNGYLSVDSGYTGIKRIIHEFDEVDSLFAKYSHLVQNESVYQINYSGEKLYNAGLLFLAHPDQSLSMSRFSFRVIFIDYYVEWVQTPQIQTKVPKFFYGNSNINTLITPFFYTSQTGIVADDILEIDELKFIVTQVEAVSTYYKVYVKPYSADELSVSKEKYIIRDYNLASTDSTYTNAAKLLFHDEYISLAMIPDVTYTSDITDSTVRNFNTTYEQANVDISNLPFYLNIDSTLNLDNEMYVADFTLTQNINTGSNVIYGITSRITDVKKGDYILVKNDVYSEIFQVTAINVSQNSYSVSRPFTKYEFLSSDDSIKVYFNKAMLFQPIILNYGTNSVNYPVLFMLEVKYLNI